LSFVDKNIAFKVIQDLPFLTSPTPRPHTHTHTFCRISCVSISMTLNHYTLCCGRPILDPLLRVANVLLRSDVKCTVCAVHCSGQYKRFSCCVPLFLYLLSIVSIVFRCSINRVAFSCTLSYVFVRFVVFCISGAVCVNVAHFLCSHFSRSLLSWGFFLFCPDVGT
jgi:hypothetical protein